MTAVGAGLGGVDEAIGVGQLKANSMSPSGDDGLTSRSHPHDIEQMDKPNGQSTRRPAAVRHEGETAAFGRVDGATTRAAILRAARDRLVEVGYA